MTTMTTNGQARKTLAQQIDRLDAILDGLADALNESVADAVKQAVGLAVEQAVRGVLAELFMNPQALARVRDAIGANSPEPAPACAAPSAPKRLRDAWLAVRHGAQQLAAASLRAVQHGRQTAAATWRRASWTLSSGRLVLVAAAVGIGLAVLAYHATPWLAATFTGFGGFVAARAAQAGDWLADLRTRIRQYIARRAFLGAQTN